MNSINTYREVNNLLTAEFAAFQKEKTNGMLKQFSSNIDALDDRNVKMLASATFIQSARAWLDKMEQTGKSAFDAS